MDVGSRMIFLCFVLLVLGLSTTDGAIVTIEPSGWWLLDEGSGTVANDSSVNGNHGTIYNPDGGLGSAGSVWYTDPERGTVASFNGDDISGAYIDAGLIIVPLTLGQDFTWGFWAKQLGEYHDPGGGGNDVVLGNRHGAADDLQFSKFTPTNFEFYDNGDNSGFINYDDLPDGAWLHHAVVKDGATFTYYRHNLDGDLIGSGTSTTTASLAVTLPFYMGGDAGGERWSGKLSDVRIFDQALTYDEVRATVPEPATIALLGLGGMALLRRRRA